MGINGLVTNLAATAYELRHTGTLNLNASRRRLLDPLRPRRLVSRRGGAGHRLRGHRTTQFAPKLPTGGSGFLASLEGGYPIPLALGPNFILEPQAQIIWQRVASTPPMTGWARRARFDLGHHGAARRARPVDPPRLRRYGSPMPAPISGAIGARGGDEFWQRTSVEVPLLEHATQLEFAGGVTAKLGARLSLFAQAGYQFAVLQGSENTVRNGVKGDFGVRYAW